MDAHKIDALKLEAQRVALGSVRKPKKYDFL